MIVTVTLNPSFDKSITINDFKLDAVNKVTDTRTDAGGKGVNVSKVLNVLGCENTASGIAGSNNYNDYAAFLDKMHIHHDFVLTHGSIRTNIKINDPVYGTTTDINEPGITHSEETLTQLKNKLLSYDNDTVFIISGSIGAKTDPNFIGELIDELGKKVIVDTSGAVLKEAVKSKPHIIKPNIYELSELMGKSITTRDEIIKSARELIDSGIHGVMVTMGSDGLLYVTENSTHFSPGISTEVKCTVGAGDAVTAGIAYSVVNDMSAVELVHLAAALGVAAVTMDGSQAPDVSRIDYYYEIANVMEI